MELQKQKNYQQTYELACASIRQMDPRQIALKSGGRYERDSDGEGLVVDFFLDSYQVRFPQVEFRAPTKKTISLVTRILILHYFMKSDGTSLSGQWVPYKDIPGGMLYASVFARRVTEPLIKEFGDSAVRFKQAGLRMGGRPVEVGDASIFFDAFPRIPLQYILWQGDEEFPPGLQLLFDRSVEHYLSLEDIVVLGQMATGRLIGKSAD
jgi:hypothetical protein